MLGDSDIQTAASGECERRVRCRRPKHVSIRIYAAEQYLRKRSEARVVAVRKFWSAEERITRCVNVRVCRAAQIEGASVVSAEIKFQSEPVIQIVGQRGASAIQ